MTAEDIAIIGAISTIIAGFGGAALGAFITYKVSTRLSNQSNYNKAAARFINAFTEIRLYLEFGIDAEDRDVVIINELLESHSVKHLSAIIDFKPFLSRYERSRLDKAWDEYCHPDGIPPDKGEKEAFIFDDYHHFQESLGEEKTKNIALEKLNNILNFAGFI